MGTTTTAASASTGIASAACCPASASGCPARPAGARATMSSSAASFTGAAAASTEKSAVNAARAAPTAADAGRAVRAAGAAPCSAALAAISPGRCGGQQKRQRRGAGQNPLPERSVAVPVRHRQPQSNRGRRADTQPPGRQESGAAITARQPADSFHDPVRECEASEPKSREAAGIDIDRMPPAITACPYGIRQLLTGMRFVKPRHRCHEATLTKTEGRLGWIAKASPSALRFRLLDERQPRTSPRICQL